MFSTLMNEREKTKIAIFGGKPFENVEFKGLFVWDRGHRSVDADTLHYRNGRESSAGMVLTRTLAILFVPTECYLLGSILTRKSKPQTVSPIACSPNLIAPIPTYFFSQGREFLWSAAGSSLIGFAFA
jgi:hypothetical protein